MIINFQFHLLFHLLNLLNNFMKQIKKHQEVHLGLQEEGVHLVQQVIQIQIKFLLLTNHISKLF